MDESLYWTKPLVIRFSLSDASGKIKRYSTERYCKLTKDQIDEHKVLLRVRIL